MPDPQRRARAGVLGPSRARQRIDLEQLEPPDALAPYVDYLWCVTWHAPDGHVQEVIPRPAVQVVAERVDGVPTLAVHGVMRRRFERSLAGADRAVAASFAPAGFHPFLRSSVSALTGRRAHLGELFGGDDRELAAHLLDPLVPPHAAARALADRLLELAPEPDPVTAELRSVVAAAETDPAITRAEHLAALAGVGLRTLQRLFTEHVGVGPKWVVQRCRLLDVAAAAHAGGPVDWADLAADLGYADQSHLIRAFTAFVGRSPAAYAADA